MSHIAESSGKKATPKLLSVADEKLRLERLKRKAVALETEAQKLARERQSAALAGHSSDDAAARSQLDKIRTATLNLQFERDSLKEGVDAQTARVSAAEIAEKRAEAKRIAVEDIERLSVR